MGLEKREETFYLLVTGSQGDKIRSDQKSLPYKICVLFSVKKMVVVDLFLL